LTKTNDVIPVKPTPLIVEAGTRKNRGACPQKPVPDTSGPIFAATPRCFFAGVPAKYPGGVGINAICSLIWPKLEK
jgi:hypothetical protein